MLRQAGHEAFPLHLNVSDSNAIAAVPEQLENGNRKSLFP